MNELTLKCTRYAIVENDYAALYVKDVDDNLPIPVIEGRGPTFDSITIIDKDAHQTKFFVCRIQRKETETMDGDWKTTVLVISYSHKEDL